MKNYIIILFLFAFTHVTGQSKNNNPRVFNVMLFGAKGDSTTDDTQAIQAAINAANAGGGGTVFFPNPSVYYRIHGALQASNSQLFIPTARASSPLRNHITLMGETKPNFVPAGGAILAGAANGIPTGTVRLVSDLTSGATGAAVIGTALAAGGGYNETFLSVENLAIQVKNNPAGGGPVIGGISYKNGGSIECDNVTVYIDTSGYRSTLPLNDVTGIETPDNAAESNNLLKNTLVVGFRSGYKIGEHTSLNVANAWICYYAFYIKQSYHTCTSIKSIAQWCVYDMYVRDFCTIANFQLDVEWQQSGKWYDDVATIKDTANQAKGAVYYSIVEANVGVNNARFSKSGGTALNTWANADGPSTFLNGVLLNQTSGTSNNVISAGSPTSGAVNNSMAITAAGKGGALSSTTGPYIAMRGNTWSTSQQRGDIFISAGDPTTPLSGEGEIRFTTGSDITNEMVIDKSGDVNVVNGNLNVQAGKLLVSAGSAIIGGATTLIASELLSIQKNQNANTSFYIQNTTSGTAARAGFGVLSGGNGIYTDAYSGGFTTSGAAIAGVGRIVTDMSAGMLLGTIASTPLTFYTNSSEKARFLTGGAFLIGGTTQNSSELFSVQKNQNAATISSLVNATNGTAARAYQNILVNSGGLYLQAFSSGYTTSGANVASTAGIITDQPSGLVFGTSFTTAPLLFYAGNAERGRWIGNGSTGLLINTTTDDGTSKLQVAGNVNLTTAGNKLLIATGTNASVGVSGAMTAGTITISTTAVTASSKIFLTHATTGGTTGVLTVGTIVAGTSFVINSSSGTDTGTVNWWIIN